jgi:mannose-1-phosphate guanylyltransferase
MYAVLMAGGLGTRFWPMSRKAYPKQLLSFSGKKTMLQQTYNRIKPLTVDEKIIVITNKNLKKEVAKQLPQIPKKNIIGEPEGKNTAPCIGLAATLIQNRTDENEIMVVLPADHLVSNLNNFRQTIRVAVDYAKDHNALITLGIQPNYPETGYGYIQVNQKIHSAKGKVLFNVKTFAEKPNLETAERFIKSGDFLWNSGMFIWSVQTVLNEFEEHLPELYEDLSLISQAIGKSGFNKFLADVYARTKPISIDYGIMESASNVVVIKSNFEWNDLGSWEAVYNISKKDNENNVCVTKNNIIVDSRNNFFHSPKKIIAAIDVENLVVVEMNDAILICNKDRSQDVKYIVDLLNRKKMNSYL